MEAERSVVPSRGELDGSSLTSSELLLRYIPDAMLVKAFNNIYFKHLRSLGYMVFDAGPLAESLRQTTGTPVWGTPYGPFSNETAQPVGEDAIRAALAAAIR